MAGLAGFEPAHDGVKVRCLTAWLRGNHSKRLVEGDGFEPSNPKEQIYSLPRLTTSLSLQEWCRKQDLNPQPTDYKSVALPIELFRHKYILYSFAIPNPLSTDCCRTVFILLSIATTTIHIRVS